MLSFSLTFAIVCYFVASALFAYKLFGQRDLGKHSATVVAFAAVVLHGIALNQSVFQDAQESLSIINVLSTISWLIATGMTIASLRFQNALLLPAIYGFNFTLLTLAYFFPAGYHINITLEPALLAHIILAVVAYGCITLATLYALQLIYIDYRLKHKTLSITSNDVPPLMEVENHLYKLLLSGTVLLTLSLITGFMFLDDMFAQGQVHKTVLSLIAWLVFCILLAGHYKAGWRGTHTVTGTVTGTILLTLAYFGSRIVKEVILAV